MARSPHDPLRTSSHTHHLAQAAEAAAVAMDVLVQASVAAAAAAAEVEQPQEAAGIATTAPGGSTLEQQRSVGSTDTCGSHERPASGPIDGGGGGRIELRGLPAPAGIGGVAGPPPAQAQATSLKAAMLLDGTPSDDDDEGVDTDDDDDDEGHKGPSATEGLAGQQEQQQGGQQQQQEQQREQRQSKHVSLRKSCEYCSNKKIKCSRHLPCNQCVKRGLVCEYALRKRLNSDFVPIIICRAGPSDPTISTKSAVIMRCLGPPKKRPAPDAAGEGGDQRQLQEERSARLLLERLEQQWRQEAAAASAAAVAMLRQHQQRHPPLAGLLPHAPIFQNQATSTHDLHAMSRPAPGTLPPPFVPMSAAAAAAGPALPSCMGVGGGLRFRVPLALPPLAQQREGAVQVGGFMGGSVQQRASEAASAREGFPPATRPAIPGPAPPPTSPSSLPLPHPATSQLEPPPLKAPNTHTPLPPALPQASPLYGLSSPAASQQQQELLPPYPSPPDQLDLQPQAAWEAFRTQHLQQQQQQQQERRAPPAPATASVTAPPAAAAASSAPWSMPGMMPLAPAYALQQLARRRPQGSDSGVQAQTEKPAPPFGPQWRQQR